MSELSTSGAAFAEAEKPVQDIEDVKFPPFPVPTDNDFEEDLPEEEKTYYKNKFPDLNVIVNVKLHCTACDRHLGCSARNENRMRPHPMLRTLICHTCHSFYNSGEFDKGEDGSELYCRWCGQGGQVYCCSDCIHVFCAKCIKRNLGTAKIKEIENADDWKCFKCNPKCLWDLRAICWALLRYCDLRNKVVFHTQDPELKEKYQKSIAFDSSECCKNKGRRKDKLDSAKKKEKEIEKVDPFKKKEKEIEKLDSAKKKEKEADVKKVLPKLPPTIQVKKFASINLDEMTPKIEKKPQKRPASPKNKIGPGYIQKPITINPCSITTPPMLKKIRLPNAPMLTPVRFANDKKITNTYSRQLPRLRPAFPIPIVNPSFNGVSHHQFTVNMPNILGDNLNLSLESLTQGLDMSAMAAFNNSPNNDVVCTPDFPLEPLCEVTEDNDDDVECITPGPVVPPKISNPPPLVPRTLPDLSSDNIVQMTENDVTVNALTGGLKFRVDPQTLSSKKMYRLPDGRIFAINPNPNMPGGYSATIVSVSDSSGKIAPKGGETYAAKLSAVAPSPTPSTTPSTSNSKPSGKSRKSKEKVTPRNKGHKTKDTSKEPRERDLKVPVEWYRYNLIDAVDAMDYSLSRLNKLKKEATTAHLRTRTVDEMKYLHRSLEQLLTTSSKRFLEIRDGLNKELKQFIARKAANSSGDLTEDDDDVEFLPNAGNDDPIFIDENSVDSVNGNDNQEVDLTHASSEHNESEENKNLSDLLSRNENSLESFKDTNNTTADFNDSETQPSEILSHLLTEHPDDDDSTNDKQDSSLGENQNADLEVNRNADLKDQTAKSDPKRDTEVTEKLFTGVTDKKDGEIEMAAEKNNDKYSDIENSKSIMEPIASPKLDIVNGERGKYNDNEESMEVDSIEQSGVKGKVDQDDEQTQDTEMSEELIETLLKGDTLDGTDNVLNTNSLDLPEELQEKK